ncbi:amidohydrolase family protein [Thalassolituus sp. LLYu03]|uniref:amidohydrolase family protein n=1 Tax=Thalassolituus sp. LLYu03 TaxID=3421656 RepID=UPI003D2AB579
MKIDIDVRFTPEILETYLNSQELPICEHALKTEADIHQYRTATSCDRVFIGCPDLSLVKEPGKAHELASSCNQLISAIARRSEGKIYTLAYIPLHNIDKALSEIDTCLNELGMDGVILSGNTNGRFLGDKMFDSVMQKLEKHKATVIVSASLHPNTAETGLQLPDFFVDKPCDITRSALNLVLSGTMEKYPTIRWILSEGGGFLPYIAWRVSLANAMAEYNSKIPAGMMNYMRRFYFVSSHSHTGFQLSSILALAGDKHLIYGSGAGSISLTKVKEQEFALLRALLDLKAGSMDVDGKHILNLFPQCATAGETVQATPRYRHVPVSIQLRQLLLSPLVKIADRIRK